MLRSKKVYIVAVFAVLIPLILCLMAAWHLQKSDSLVRQSQSQDTPAILRKADATNLGPAIPDSTRFQLQAAYGNLPLSFEPNRGQTDPRVKFLSRAGNRTLWLTSDEAVLAVARQSRLIRPDQNRETAAKAGMPRAQQATPAVLRMKFVGANADAQIAGENKQPGTINYFGGKPNEWRTKIPTYARVRYRSLYPGIDLVFYGNNRELEYDLVVSPGADPGRIRLEISGAENLHLKADGNLVMKTAAGDVIQQKPRIYQRKGNSLVAVKGDYVTNGKDEVGFRLGSYDRRAAVVIDPALRYSTFLGGGLLDNSDSIAVDFSGQAVVAGQTCSPDFPGNSQDGCSLFAVKFDFTGSRLVFAVFLAHTNIFPTIALDAAGSVYMTGLALPEFHTTHGAFQPTAHSGNNGFVAKLNSSGTDLIYATFLGGSGFDLPSGIAVDSSGNAYVTGRTSSSDFPTTSGAFQRECKLSSTGTCQSAFVTKLNANGSRALFSTFLGGHGEQNSGGIAVDKTGNAFVAGTTDASDFPTTAGSTQPVFAGGGDVFVTELSSSGSHLIYSTYLGGTGSDSGNAIALDSRGNAFVTGETFSTNFPVKNAFQARCALTSGSCASAFVAKLNTNGRLLYSTFLGGGVDGADRGSGVAATANGQAYVTGSTNSTRFPTTQTSFQRISGGSGDTFIAKFDPSGKQIYSSYLGG
jgi:Beta-propeller repeat